MNVLIDSSGWIEFFACGKNVDKWKNIVLASSKKNSILPTTVIYEVYKKIKMELSEEKADEAIAYMLDSSTIIPLDEEVALYAADLSIEKKLPMADAIIKATADLNNACIKTGDKHFKGLENVEII